MPMNPHKARLALLKAEVDKYATVAEFVRAHPGMNETYIRNLLAGRDSFGERAASNMGKLYFGSSDYFMPRPTGTPVITTDVTLDAILKSLKSLPPAAVDRIKVEVDYLAQLKALGEVARPPKAKRSKSA